MQAVPPSKLISDHSTTMQQVLAAAENSFPYTPKFRAFRGAQGAYIDEGPRSAPVLLCLHGNPTWAYFYRRLIAKYAGSMRVVVPDHIGMGLSERPSDFEYTLENRIQAMEDLVTSLDLRRITLVAHDWGGAIGVGLAGRHPERFARIVLSNTASFHGGKAHSLIRIARIPGLHQLLMGRLGLFEKITVKHACKKRLPKEVREAYLAPFGSPAARVAVRAFVRDIPLSQSHKSYATLSEVEAGMAKLQHLPKLLLWGMRDWVFHKGFKERFQEIWPEAQSVELPDAGHLLWEDEPERCLAALEDFFDRFPLPVQ